MLKTLKKLGLENVTDDWTFDQAIIASLDHMPNYWRKRDANSEIAFQVIIIIFQSLYVTKK